VGILSQGLRIAPPEAPKTGYRFGKGCYFADVRGLFFNLLISQVISKSGAYCFANPQNPVGLMILNEVALGNMYQIPQDEYMEQGK
jgi:poly [ADP-ribose] polymerase